MPTTADIGAALKRAVEAGDQAAVDELDAALQKSLEMDNSGFDPEAGVLSNAGRVVGDAAKQLGSNIVGVGAGAEQGLANAGAVAQEGLSKLLSYPYDTPVSQALQESGEASRQFGADIAQNVTSEDGILSEVGLPPAAPASIEIGKALPIGAVGSVATQPLFAVGKLVKASTPFGIVKKIGTTLEDVYKTSPAKLAQVEALLAAGGESSIQAFEPDTTFGKIVAGAVGAMGASGVLGMIHSLRSGLSTYGASQRDIARVLAGEPVSAEEVAARQALVEEVGATADTAELAMSETLAAQRNRLINATSDQGNAYLQREAARAKGNKEAISQYLESTLSGQHSDEVAEVLVKHIDGQEKRIAESLADQEELLINARSKEEVSEDLFTMFDDAKSATLTRLNQGYETLGTLPINSAPIKKAVKAVQTVAAKDKNFIVDNDVKSAISAITKELSPNTSPILSAKGQPLKTTIPDTVDLAAIREIRSKTLTLSRQAKAEGRSTSKFSKLISGIDESLDEAASMGSPDALKLQALNTQWREMSKTFDAGKLAQFFMVDKAGSARVGSSEFVRTMLHQTRNAPEKITQMLDAADKFGAKAAVPFTKAQVVGKIQDGYDSILYGMSNGSELSVQAWKRFMSQYGGKGGALDKAGLLGRYSKFSEVAANVKGTKAGLDDLRSSQLAALFNETGVSFNSKAASAVKGDKVAQFISNARKTGEAVSKDAGKAAERLAKDAIIQNSFNYKEALANPADSIKAFSKVRDSLAKDVGEDAVNRIGKVLNVMQVLGLKGKGGGIKRFNVAAGSVDSEALTKTLSKRAFEKIRSLQVRSFLSARDFKDFISSKNVVRYFEDAMRDPKEYEKLMKLYKADKEVVGFLHSQMRNAIATGSVTVGEQ